MLTPVIFTTLLIKTKQNINTIKYIFYSQLTLIYMYTYMIIRNSIILPKHILDKNNSMEYKYRSKEMYSQETDNMHMKIELTINNKSIDAFSSTTMYIHNILPIRC